MSRVKEILSIVKVNQLQQRIEFLTKLLAVSTVLTPILQSPLAWESFLNIYYRISSLLDYLTYGSSLKSDTFHSGIVEGLLQMSTTKPESKPM
jgi:hypothetical protein